MAFRSYSDAVTPGPGVWPHPGCRPGLAEVAPWGGGLHAVVPGVPAGVLGPPRPQASPPVLRGECEWTCGWPLLCIWRGFGGFFFLCVSARLLLLKSGPSWVSLQPPAPSWLLRVRLLGPPPCPVFVPTLKPALGSAGALGVWPPLPPPPRSWSRELGAALDTRHPGGVWAVSGS